MKYSDIRKTIKTGDVLAWSHRGWKSWYDIKIQMVRFFTQSEFSHVGLAIIFGGRVWVLEAVTPKVRLVPLSNLLPCYVVSGNGLSHNSLEAGFDLIGKDTVNYSQSEAVKAYFKKNDRTNSAIQCAELVNSLLLLDCQDTPAATVECMLKNGSTLKEITK